MKKSSMIAAVALLSTGLNFGGGEPMFRDCSSLPEHKKKTGALKRKRQKKKGKK